MARTQQQIIEQCAARYAELQEQHAQKLRQDALGRCATCRWCDQHGRSDPSYWRCNEPLVRGFDREGPWIYDAPDGTGRSGGAVLCGPEKALWQPAAVKGSGRAADWAVGLALVSAPTGVAAVDGWPSGLALLLSECAVLAVAGLWSVMRARGRPSSAEDWDAYAQRVLSED